MPERFQNVRELLEARVELVPNMRFLFGQEDGRVFSYREFDRRVNRAANLLRSVGADHGARVSLLLTNSVEYIVFYFACFKIGAWAGPVNALLKSQEIEFIARNSESSIIVSQSNLYPAVAAVRCSLPSLGHVILADSSAETEGDVIGYRSAESQPAELDQVDISGEDEAVIIYTSGTTGKPKGVLLTHGNLISNAQQIAEWLGLTNEDRSLVIMPLFHVNALMTTVIAALWAGASVVLAPRFSASRHWQIISDFGVTYFGSVATMLSLLNQTHPDGVPGGCDISKLRFALCGSAPVPIEVMNRFESLFHCPVIEGYGLSESTCRSTFNPIEGRRPGSVGLPIGNEVKIFDEDDRELLAGEIGEIVLRGPNVMKGYYRNEEATRQAFRSGWLHTGDLGYRDREGFFYVVDRKNDMIIRGGENVYPREIDEVLYRHPAVEDAATIGVPDALLGEEVKSFVVLRDDATATEQQIVEFCRERLADFKCPKSVVFLDDIPKGPTGKLLKRELAARSSEPREK